MPSFNYPCLSLRLLVRPQLARLKLTVRVKARTLSHRGLSGTEMAIVVTVIHTLLPPLLSLGTVCFVIITLLLPRTRAPRLKGKIVSILVLCISLGNGIVIRILITTRLGRSRLVILYMLGRVPRVTVPCIVCVVVMAGLRLRRLMFTFTLTINCPRATAASSGWGRSRSGSVRVRDRRGTSVGH